MPIPQETCVITVTYGTRHEYVRDLINGARQNGVGHIVVVDNGSHAASSQELTRIAEDGESHEITILSLGENRGSAAGFKKGLRYVYEQTTYPYVWFLDDDNVPEPAALQRLLHAYGTLKDRYPDQAICLLSLRAAKRWVWRVAYGASPDTVFLRRSSFCGFHLADVIPQGWWQRWSGRRRASAASSEPIPLRFAPYGGLWMPTQLVGEVGYPDERLVLYHDDTEFTHRLVQRGARLFLVPGSHVRDVELSWAQVKPWRHGFARMLLSESDLRLFYNTRNKVYYEVHQRENSRAMLAVNEAAFWVLLYVFSFLYRAATRRQLVKKAVLDGKRAVLGNVLPLHRGSGLDMPSARDTDGEHRSI